MEFIFLRDSHHKTSEERELISEKPYDLVVGSVIHAILCIGQDIFYAEGIVSRYKSDLEVEH